WKMGVKRIHVSREENDTCIWKQRKTTNQATTWKRLAVSAGDQKTGGQQSGQCDQQSDLWRSPRGEKGAWRTYGLCGTNQLDLTTDEWKASSQDAFLLKRASVAQSC